jgi:hypothetical protein
VLCFKLPDVAVIVAVYVPTCVPGVVCEDEPPPPPHPKSKPSVKTIIGVANTGSLRRRCTSRNAEPSKINIHANGKVPDGKLMRREIVPVVTGAVVATMTVTGAALPALTCTELGKLHVGAGVTRGLILHVKSTVPLNDPAGVTAKSNVAVWPALIVCERDDPDAGPTPKPATASTTKEAVVL